MAQHSLNFLLFIKKGIRKVLLYRSLVLPESGKFGHLELSYPQFDPLVEQPPVVELAQEAGLGDGVGRVAHLAASARHITEVVVALLAKDRRTPHQGNRLLVLRPRVLQIPVGEKTS